MSCNSLQWKRNKQKKNTHTHILSHSVVSDSLRPHGLQHAGSSVYGDSPSKNTRVGCPALLQGIFPTQGLNPVLPHCRWILYHISHHRSPSAHIYIYLNHFAIYLKLTHYCSSTILHFLEKEEIKNTWKNGSNHLLQYT